MDPQAIFNSELGANWPIQIDDEHDLVGGFNHLEKYKFVNGKDDIPYMKRKIKFMFETTNQWWFTMIYLLYVEKFFVFYSYGSYGQ